MAEEQAMVTARTTRSGIRNDDPEAAASIYRISSIETGQSYVGSTTRHPGQRWAEHLHHLRRGNHYAKALQRVYDQYGEDDLHFGVVGVVSDATERHRLEQQHINRMGDKCLNGSRHALPLDAAHAACRGRVATDEERRRKSASARLGIAEGRIVRGPWSEERKAAHSIRLTGRKMPPVTEQTRINISEGHRRRRERLGIVAKQKSDRYKFLQSELPAWLALRASGNSYRAIESITGRCRQVISRECKRALADAQAAILPLARQPDTDAAIAID